MTESHYRPLSNTALIIGFLGIVLSLWLWQYTIEWAFTLLIFFLIVCIAAYINVMRAPLTREADYELAIHEKYRGRRYPDTDLHSGLIPEEKIESISPHRRALRKHLATKASGKRKTVKKVAKKSVRKPVKKKAVKKVVKRVVKKVAKKGSVKRPTKAKSVRKPVKKKTVKKVVKRVSAKKKVSKKATKRTNKARSKKSVKR